MRTTTTTQYSFANKKKTPLKDLKNTENEMYERWRHTWYRHGISGMLFSKMIKNCDCFVVWPLSILHWKNKGTYSHPSLWINARHRTVCLHICIQRDSMKGINATDKKEIYEKWLLWILNWNAKCEKVRDGKWAKEEFPLFWLSFIAIELNVTSLPETKINNF